MIPKYSMQTLLFQRKIFISAQVWSKFSQNIRWKKRVGMKFSQKNNKRVGWNKRVGRKNSQNLINVQDGIRACRMENSKKIINFAA